MASVLAATGPPISLDIPLGWGLALAIFLVGLNGFFVAAEFALVKAKGFRIEALAEDGSRSARMTRRILGNLEAYLAACQLGITMASLGLGWIGEPTVAALLEPLFRALGLPEEALHTVAFVIGFVAFSSLHIVVGEQVPKTFAIRKPEPVSLLCAYPLYGFYVLIFPLNWALNRASGAILSWFKVGEASHADVLSDEELKGLIDVSREHGRIGEEKAAMLSNLFAFDERTVGRVMVPRGDVDVLEIDASAEKNTRALAETQRSRFPIVEQPGGNPVGVVLAKEVLYTMLAGEADPWGRLRSFVREALYVPESLRIGALFDMMRVGRQHMALVVDEYGDFIGLVTLEDLLEEIVGEIVDETDEDADEHPVVPTDRGWEAHGLAPLGDVCRATGMTIPPDIAANTLSGLFMQRLKRMPEIGDSLVEGGFELTVQRLEDRHVGAVEIRATLPPPEPTGEPDPP